MDKLHVEAEQTAWAAPRVCLGACQRRHDAIPGGDRGARPATAVREHLAGRPGRGVLAGSSRRYGLRRPSSVEKFLDAEEGRRLVYTVIGGIPVRNYRAEVTLAPVWRDPIRWAAAWDRDPAGRGATHHCERCTRRSSPTSAASAAEKQAAPVRASATPVPDP